LTPAFLLATDLQPHEADWPEAERQAASVAAATARILSFEPVVQVASVASYPGEGVSGHSLAEVLSQQDSAEVFVLPAALDFNLWQREEIGRVLAEQRRERADVSIHHDDPDLGHPLLVQCFADQAARALTSPQRAGVIVAASGHGDPGARAQSYRFMRLLWEQAGFGKGAVGFVRHAQPFLRLILEQCAAQHLEWALVPQSQWKSQHVEFTEVILRDFLNAHPGSSQFHLAQPPGNHPALTAWFAQRITRLWQEKRSSEAARAASPKRKQAASEPTTWKVGDGRIARHALAQVIGEILPQGKPERVLVKVTWHGYATGTYTDPAALDLLLGALPCPAVILEGHTSSRCVESASFDWETEARQNRAWIRQQEAEYLRRTGLCDVLARHGAQYVNVTEAYWDESCVAPEEIGVPLRHPELAGFVPQALLPYRGCPFISFAKFKGPTRLSISNLFGLIPAPLRSAWHGPNITWFARVCCDLAKLYGSLFDVYAVNEALYSAVRWNRKGLYRSRWGNYDLIHDAGIAAASRGLVTADILASRLQGQDVERSAFFDVVESELGWDAAAATAELPPSTQCLR
jgi:sirohydrochlorin ferrochelatase